MMRAVMKPGASPSSDATTMQASTVDLLRQYGAKSAPHPLPVDAPADFGLSGRYMVDHISPCPLIMRRATRAAASRLMRNRDLMERDLVAFGIVERGDLADRRGVRIFGFDALRSQFGDGFVDVVDFEYDAATRCPDRARIQSCVMMLKYAAADVALRCIARRRPLRTRRRTSDRACSSYHFAARRRLSPDTR